MSESDADPALYLISRKYSFRDVHIFYSSSKFSLTKLFECHEQYNIHAMLLNLINFYFFDTL